MLKLLKQSPISVTTQRRRTAVRCSVEETDVVVIGSGLGGLSCGALAAKYGLQVTVFESHDIPGGAAHTWVKDGFHFESGPSLYSGMAGRGKQANPIAHVLQALEQDLDLIQYEGWNVMLPEGTFHMKIGNDNFPDILQQIRGPEAVQQWRELQRIMVPYSKAASAIPPASIRYDFGVLRTVLLRYAQDLLTTGGNAAKLVGPYSKLIEGTITDPFLINWLDLLCFLLSGVPANGTIAAEVAFMFNEWYRPNAVLEFPKGGGQALVNALVKGLKKYGGKIQLKSHVEEVIVEQGKAVGVRLRGGKVVRARKGVVSNASAWDTLRLLNEKHVPREWTRSVDEMPRNRSFMHAHVGFDASGLEDLDLHHIVVNTWENGVDSEQNVVLVSIASVVDPTLAPEGHHALHAYLPATEPFERWEGLERGSPEYMELKEERSQVIWKALERIIPDIRQRAKIQLIGTPLTHQHYLRRHKGTYGPGIIAGEGVFPGPKSPIPGLLMCGDSTFPGIGVPAVAASGNIVANSLVSVGQHEQLLEELGL